MLFCTILLFCPLSPSGFIVFVVSVCVCLWGVHLQACPFVQPFGKIYNK